MLKRFDPVAFLPKRNLTTVTNAQNFAKERAVFRPVVALRTIKPFYFAKRKLQPLATILVALAISIPISAQTITTFDAPGAGAGPGQVWSIAPNGAVTGFFFDPNNVVHGFVREADAGALGLPKFYRTSNSWPTDATT